MKAITAVCATGASVPAIVNGRISRHRDGENAEIQMYLSKLKDLVPYMPKNRKLSKLEIIQHVIDYICDLQSELETHPAVNNFDAAAALNGQQQQQSYYQETQHHHHQQQHQYQQQQQNYHQAEMNNAISAADPSRVNYGGNSNSIASSSLLSSSPLSVMTSSPPVRQPLSDRPAPNTILSPSHNNPLSSPTVILAGHQSNHLTINTQNHLHTISDKDTNDRSKSC